MNRLAIATLLIGFGASGAPAQQPGAEPPITTTQPPVTTTQPLPKTQPPVTTLQPPVLPSARPPIPPSLYGLGGYPVTKPVVVPRPRPMFTSNPNVFNYDSGDYLLGGFDGFARAQGSFTMGVPPGSRPAGCQTCQPWVSIPPQPVIVIFDVVKP